MCERCSLGRSRLSGDTTDSGPSEETAAPADRVPCAGCGRTTVEDHEYLALSLAEGYCLSCRVQGLRAG
jgi:hypothetical protein